MDTIQVGNTVYSWYTKDNQIYYRNSNYYPQYNDSKIENILYDYLSNNYFKEKSLIGYKYIELNTEFKIILDAIGLDINFDSWEVLHTMKNYKNFKHKITGQIL